MYAQYQYYQQQQQQPMSSTASSQQGGLTWNGSAWVPSSTNAVQSGTYSTYETHNKPAATAASTASAIPPNPVATYTQYYHGWDAHGKQCEAQLRSIPLGNKEQRQEAQRRVDWAKYYADQSSRAAHHFYQNPNATSAPFDLPPAPAAMATSIGPAIAASTSTPQRPSLGRTTAQPAASTSTFASRHSGSNKLSSSQTTTDKITPGSLTRYVKKCLDQCSTDELRKAVQAEVEKVIAQAIQAGNLHSKNWDLESLIPVPGATPIRNNNSNNTSFPTSPYQQQQQHRNSHNATQSNVHSNSNGYYGHGSPTSNMSRQPNNRYVKPKQYDSNISTNDSYYGNSGGSPPASSSRNSLVGNKRFAAAATQSENYYGPANPSTSPYGDAASSIVTSQKHHVGSHNEDDYMSFQQHQPQRKKSKNYNNKHAAGFEKSVNAMAKRANRFSGPGGIMDASNTGTTVDDHDRYMGKKLIGGSDKKLSEQDFENMTVKGTCQTLEKEYLRLTAPPRAELVRPQPILERHLANLKKQYKRKSRDYLWFCSQLKAVRQDCTVQRIQNAFGVDVYETHAQIALQEGDLNEYNQCQTQLKELYETHEGPLENHEEFIAYRLLYYVFLTTNESYDGGSSDMFKIMLSLTCEQRSHPAIAHALNVREAFAFGDYLRFFRLHDKSPNLGRYLTSPMVPTMRLRALRRMAKAYRPSVDVEFCLRQLGMESIIEEGKKYLLSCGCVIEGSNLMMKDSTTIHEPEVDKKNSLI